MMPLRAARASKRPYPRIPSHADDFDGAGAVETGAGQRIVVVGDDPVLRAILRGYLEDAGYRVAEAVDGGRLVDSLPRLDPALVLLDVKLPGANGFDLLRTIRARSDLPVIMVNSSG